ncbi:MAG: hypothetical protein JNN33_05670 [Rhodospirillaceae bacterium]|nr:hypothetical protein [Rhodospirillaceae bacterium]
MSGDRLDRGFVNWRGQRVFVPWFGAPRVAPSAEDEVRVLKNRFRLDWIVAVTVVPFLAAGAWIVSRESLLALVLGLWAVFAGVVLIEHRRVRRWPRLTSARFSRSTFLLSYYRSLPRGERVSTLFWSGLVAFLCIQWLSTLISNFTPATAGDSRSAAMFGALLFALLVLAFLALRNTVILLLSFKPENRRAQGTA